MVGFSRREFVASVAATTALGSTAARAALAKDVPWRGEKVIDCHFHARPSEASMIAHLDGSGCTHGLVSAADDLVDRIPALLRKYPSRFPGWTRTTRLVAESADGTGQPLIAGAPATTPAAAVANLRNAVHLGARGFAETIGALPVDGPEFQRLFALASELDVPIMMHFQQGSVPNLPRYGVMGFSRIEAMLKKYPKTRFICHASDFWGHIDARYEDGGTYLTGKVQPGGLADRLLSDYPNIYGDFSAPSGLFQLSRDPDFTSEFLIRQQDKLLFGSDCGCADGRGAVAVPPAGAPPAAATSGAPGARPAGATNMQTSAAAQGGFAGKCIARELLSIAWKTTPRPVFRKLVWGNAHRTYLRT
jgi:hypothetical protein